MLEPVIHGAILKLGMALLMDMVLRELRENAATQFDPDIVEIILKGKVPLL